MLTKPSVRQYWWPSAVNSVKFKDQVLVTHLSSVQLNAVVVTVQMCDTPNIIIHGVQVRVQNSVI